MRKIYVRLLDEGTEVYRPVSAIKLRDNLYEIKILEKYDSDDEAWEFPPGSRVIVKERILEGKSELVAIAGAE